MEASPRLIAAILLGVGVALMGAAVGMMVWWNEKLLVLPIAGPFLTALGLGMLVYPDGFFNATTRKPRPLGIALGIGAAIVFLAWYIPWAGITLDSL